jgi:hypothetical protein
MELRYGSDDAAATCKSDSVWVVMRKPMSVFHIRFQISDNYCYNFLSIVLFN